MHHWTRRWWNERRQIYNLLTSTAVLAELDKGTLPNKEESLEMAMSLPAIPVDDEVAEIAEAYVRVQDKITS